MAKAGKKGRILFLTFGALAILVAVSGCQEIGFYKQAVAGEYEILAHQKPIPGLIANPQTPARVKKKLEQVMKIRSFAAEELKLPADKSYIKYVDLHRPYVVWNVNAAPPLSLDPKTWWFPVVGRASYRGYFHEADALHYAERWKKKGWDIYVDGISTYSTLGWFHDPILNTFLFEPETDLAETIFHELGHRRLFVSGDTDFNEAYATTVAAEGIRRWFAAATNAPAYAAYQRDRAHEKDFVNLVMACRDKLAAVYDDKNLSDSDKLKRKEQIIQGLRDEYAQTKIRWGEPKSGYDYWFAEPINNAKLNTVSAYYDLAPAFEALLRAQGGDLEKFYRAVGDIGRMPLQQRHQKLRSYLQTTPAS